MKKVKIGLLFAIISPILSTLATVFLAGATKLLTPLLAASISGIVGSAIILAYMKLTKHKIDIRKIRKNRKDLGIMTMLRGTLGIAIFTYGLSLTDAIKAIFFTKVEPYFVLIFHWLLLKEKVKKEHVILLTIHVFGAILLSTGGNFMSFGKAQLGDFLVILTMGIFALSYIYGKRLSVKLGAKISNTVMLGMGGLILMPFALAFSPTSITHFPTLGWGYLLLNIVLFNVIGLTLWFASLKSVKGWMVSALRSIGPIVGAPIAFLVFGVPLTIVQILGAGIVTATSALIAREHLKKEKKK